MAKPKNKLADRARQATAARKDAAGQSRQASAIRTRENAIESVLGGGTKEVTQRLVDPATCRPWRRANRIYEHLTPENCADLIDTIAIDGQRIPAIVRRLPASEQQDYEIIAGARRHYAVTYLREERGREDVRYLVEPHQLTDEEAFRISDYENRSRRDISEYERGRDYASALAEFYDGNVSRMAEGIGQPRSTLKLYLSLAGLPDQVLNAYPSPTEIPVRHAQKLGPALRDTTKADVVLSAASELAAEQDAARAGEGAFVPAPMVLKRLTELTTTGTPTRKKVRSRIVSGTNGNPLFSVRETAASMELRFNVPTGSERDALLESIRQALEQESDT